MCGARSFCLVSARTKASTRSLKAVPTNRLRTGRIRLHERATMYSKPPNHLSFPVRKRFIARVLALEAIEPYRNRLFQRSTDVAVFNTVRAAVLESTWVDPHGGDGRMSSPPGERLSDFVGRVAGHADQLGNIATSQVAQPRRRQLVPFLSAVASIASQVDCEKCARSANLPPCSGNGKDDVCIAAGGQCLQPIR